MPAQIDHTPVHRILCVCSFFWLLGLLQILQIPLEALSFEVLCKFSFLQIFKLHKPRVYNRTFTVDSALQRVQTWIYANKLTLAVKKKRTRVPHVLGHSD